ncbi:MAG TPA: FAD-dependent oxidoreductase [Solirubrobacteraceae bacterium]
MSNPRIAIVGAGPAGAYAARELLRSGRGIEVDLFERLPTPWGLLRGGVAPDHQEIKELADRFEDDLIGPRCRLFANVEVGRDISHEQLTRRYHAVVYAVGAQTNKSLGIPGEDLPGSLPATEFVGWYNGHPDYRDLAPDLSAERAVIIGNGNVAADVARVLLRPVDELALTDIADHALDALRDSAVREVVIVGRRGPAQVAFSSAELYDLGRITGVDVVVEEVDAGDDAPTSFTARKNVELLDEFARREPTGAPRRLVLRFLRSPLRIVGEDHVTGIELAVNELYRDDADQIRPRTTDQTETLDCGLVMRSVGYQAVPIPDVPFDEKAYVLPNEQGRVADGVYAVGWIKRGPTGILGTNKRDAEETIASLVADLDAGKLAAPPELGADPELSGHLSFEAWKAIDASEVESGRPSGRPRVKFCTVDELLAAASVPSS